MRCTERGLARGTNVGQEVEGRAADALAAGAEMIKLHRFGDDAIDDDEWSPQPMSLRAEAGAEADADLQSGSGPTTTDATVTRYH